MGQLDVTIYELEQLDLDNRTEYAANIDIVENGHFRLFSRTGK